MKLYSVDLSPYAARVRMQIYAKGISDITFERPEHWGMPAFRERFPIVIGVASLPLGAAIEIDVVAR